MFKNKKNMLDSCLIHKMNSDLEFPKMITKADPCQKFGCKGWKKTEFLDSDVGVTYLKQGDQIPDDVVDGDRILVRTSKNWWYIYNFVMNKSTTTEIRYVTGKGKKKTIKTTIIANVVFIDMVKVDVSMKANTDAQSDDSHSISSAVNAPSTSCTII
jgi:hypothetical protein